MIYYIVSVYIVLSIQFSCLSGFCEIPFRHQLKCKQASLESFDTCKFMQEGSIAVCSSLYL